MARFCLYDVANLVYRVSFATGGSLDEDSLNLTLANTIKSMRMPFDLLRATHAVMCFDHVSWRRRVMESYKANRDERKSGPDAKKFEAIGDVITDFRRFLQEHSNTTVLQVPGCEADDLIARFAAIHPDDECVIISSDSDFRQLVTERVWVYDPVAGRLLTHEGVFLTKPLGKVKRGTPTKEIRGVEWIVDCEDGIPKAFDPKKYLFMKILAGDQGDNVPRASVLRTKKTLIEEAWNYPGGVAWSNIMGATRTDLDDKPTVGELFKRNELLIDLSKIPEDICALSDEAIIEAVQKPPTAGLGMKFMLFCRSRGMVALGSEVERYVPMLSARYA